MADSISTLTQLAAPVEQCRLTKVSGALHAADQSQSQAQSSRLPAGVLRALRQVVSLGCGGPTLLARTKRAVVAMPDTCYAQHPALQRSALPIAIQLGMPTTALSTDDHTFPSRCFLLRAFLQQ